MNVLTRSVISILLAFTMGFSNSILLADPGQGQGGGKGQGKMHGKGHAPKMHGHKNAHIKSSKAAVKQVPGAKSPARFSANDRTTISKYFNAHPQSGKSLPPGIAMNLARGKPLPPGIAKRYLPNDLLATLPTYPGAEYLLVGKDAVLVNSTTGIVTDIIANVLR